MKRRGFLKTLGAVTAAPVFTWKRAEPVPVPAPSATPSSPATKAAAPARFVDSRIKTEVIPHPYVEIDGLDISEWVRSVTLRCSQLCDEYMSEKGYLQTIPLFSTTRIEIQLYIPESEPTWWGLPVGGEQRHLIVLREDADRPAGDDNQEYRWSACLLTGLQCLDGSILHYELTFEADVRQVLF